MSFSLPVDRPSGRTLVVGSPDCRAFAGAILGHLGYVCCECDDPYVAMAELCRRPSGFRNLVVSLVGLYREELAFISSIKRRFPQIEIWLSQTDGRAAALAEASRLGASGLLADDGLHRFAVIDSPPQSPLPLSAVIPQSPAAMSIPPPVVAPRMAMASDESSAPLLEATRENSSRELTMLDAPAGEAVLTADELRALLQDQPLRGATDAIET